MAKKREPMGEKAHGSAHKGTLIDWHELPIEPELDWRSRAERWHLVPVKKTQVPLPGAGSNPLGPRRARGSVATAVLDDPHVDLDVSSVIQPPVIERLLSEDESAEE